MNKILVIAAHSDDETLGMGATIARHVANKDEVRLITMTDGVSARETPNHGNSPHDSERLTSLQQAAKTLGISKVYSFNFPDNKMDSVALLDVIKVIEGVISKYSPSIIYTHSSCDLNIDHLTTHKAVMTACRPQPSSSVKSIFCFEVRSATEWQPNSMAQFTPNYFVDITDFIEIKMTALDCYKQELREYPHSRSKKAIEAHAISRGTSVGYSYAEAFFIERMLQSK